MVLFTASNFKEKWLEFSKDFVIDDSKSTIFLGPNGIGKTKVYNTIKKNHPLLGYFSYEDCTDKIIKEKKNLTISVRIEDIEKANAEKDNIKDKLDIKKNGFNKHRITSASKAREYSEYCKNIYDNNEFGIINFKENGITILFDYKSDNIDKKEFMLKNVKKLNELKIQENELNKIKDKYILEAADLIEHSLDVDDRVCPICGCEHQNSLLDILRERKKLYENNLNDLIVNYMKITKENKNVVYEDIKEMCNFVSDNEIDEEIVSNYLMIGDYLSNINEIKKAQAKIIELNDNINKYEIERTQFYQNLCDNWTNVEQMLKMSFKEDIVIVQNHEQKSILITLKRDASSYSTGELNYIVFLLNVLEFEYSNKNTIIIDDPLSSYDIKKQYEIAFDIISKLVNKGKKVIIFTHNINLINIINTQYPAIFNYKILEKINNIVRIYSINLTRKDSILNVENLISGVNDATSKKMLELLLKKDLYPEGGISKLYHFDGEYSYDGISNMNFIDIVNDFDINTLEELNFSDLAAKKILFITSMRVWIEKQIFDNFNGSFNGKKELMEKLEYFFAHREMWKYQLNITKEDIARKKVLLNQNSHYKSQIIPFYYALSISWDDIIDELYELKEKFKITNRIV